MEYLYPETDNTIACMRVIKEGYMERDQSGYYSRAQLYARDLDHADDRPGRPLASSRGRVSRNRLRSPVTYLLVGALGSIMAMGAFALYRVTVQQSANIDVCESLQMLVFSEVDEVLAHGQFPSRDQQDRWRQLMQACPS